ncbi:MAG: LL-diaminopimelate aminotransferase [Oscillospiraceae bacterium]|jgi:LL-diaminopimelate aminotransferase|nr:LL-diaminopimelate aminotransferase [Oscillospiraceae bacterium]
MLKTNENFKKLGQNYLFATIGRKVSEYQTANPGKTVIRLGIGDVTRPLCPSVIAAMHKAVEDMSSEKTFKGYGEDYGYSFLREAISKNDYAPLGVNISTDEIFISDGAKSDCGNIGDIFDRGNTVAVCDPVYPVYVDTNVMAGRAGELIDGNWSDLIYMPCTAENGFVPAIPDKKADIIYLCYPNNPTGAHCTYEQLKAWVDYANKNGSVILYDAAYSAFVSEGLPVSIFEVEGAKECAIEFKSFSKTAGFTGVRCAYTVIPKELKRDGMSLNAMWARRQSTKFNEASYVSQRGAEAIYTEQGKKETAGIISFYKNNAAVIRNGLSDAGFEVYGGVNAPYIWMKTPDNLSSWDFFDRLLNEVQVVGTPGSGFGPSGEGYFRLTAFGSLENSLLALERIKKTF